MDRAGASRRSFVLGLNDRPRMPTFLPCNPPSASWNLSYHAAALLGVDGSGGSGYLHGITGAIAHLHERGQILRKTGPSESWSRMEKFRADPVVQAHAFCNHLNVRSRPVRIVWRSR